MQESVSYVTDVITLELEGDVLMITSGNNASKNECPMRYR